MQANQRCVRVQIKAATATENSECQSSKSVKESQQNDFHFYSARKRRWIRWRKIGMRAMCTFKGRGGINVKKISFNWILL